MKNLIKLSNGLKVQNLNSPHEFKFEDGSILPAVPKSFSLSTMLENEDIEVSKGKFTVVSKHFMMTARCMDALISACDGRADVVIAPLPVVMLINGSPNEIAAQFPELTIKKVSQIKSKVHTCYLVDRVNKIYSISKFCK